MQNKPGAIALMGSGELAESMAKVHRQLMSRIAAPINAVFVDTPAGFEVNADEISAKAVEYFQRFSIALTIASFKSAARATSDEVDSAVRKIQRANYIFAGPGSPTYAVHNWKNSPVWETLTRRLDAGASLALASAAAIAISHYALPVYEIFKAGEDPRWNDGLNLLARYSLDLVVIPHWNNTEGGTYDTRFCYMGAERFKALERTLPDSTVVLGIDEYTACIIDLAQMECRVIGAGQVTLRSQEREEFFPSGVAFKLEQLRSGVLPAPSGVPPQSPSTATRPAQYAGAQTLQTEIERARSAFAVDPAAWNLTDAARALYELAKGIDDASAAGVKAQMLDQARGVLRELGLVLSDRAASGDADLGNAKPFVDLLVEIRTKLRAARQFTLADQVRDELIQLGIQLEDSPAGTRWKKLPEHKSGG